VRTCSSRYRCVARCKLKIAASPTQPSRLPAQVPPTCKYSGGILRLEDKFLVIMSTPPENNRQLFSGGVLIITITAQKHEPPSLRTFELQVNRRRDLQLSVAIIITSAPAASSKVETLSVPDSELLGGLSAARHTCRRSTVLLRHVCLAAGNIATVRS
jgi:hypothetical protein